MRDNNASLSQNEFNKGETLKYCKVSVYMYLISVRNRDIINRVASSLQVWQHDFTVRLPARIQLLRVFSIGKRSRLLLPEIFAFFDDQWTPIVIK